MNVTIAGTKIVDSFMFRCSLLQPCCHVYGTVVNNHAFCLHESFSQKQLSLSLNCCQAKSGQEHYRVHVKKNMIDVILLEQGVQITNWNFSVHALKGFTYFKNLNAQQCVRAAVFPTINVICLYTFHFAAVRRRARSKIRICTRIGRMYLSCELGKRDITWRQFSEVIVLDLLAALFIIYFLTARNFTRWILRLIWPENPPWRPKTSGSITKSLRSCLP